MPPAVYDAVLVEVDVGAGLRWKRAEVRSLLRGAGGVWSRFSVVVNQMKLAFMFPHKLVPENILDNGIALRGEATEAKRTAL